MNLFFESYRTSGRGLGSWTLAPGVLLILFGLAVIVFPQILQLLIGGFFIAIGVALVGLGRGRRRSGGGGDGWTHPSEPRGPFGR